VLAVVAQVIEQCEAMTSDSQKKRPTGGTSIYWSCDCVRYQKWVSFFRGKNVHKTELD